jgi:hypothetical protein
MKVGDIVSGYGDETGIYLNIINKVDDDTTELQINFYDPEHKDFAWALEQLDLLGDN